MFPACAGVSPWRERTRTQLSNVPRVCGGEPEVTWDMVVFAVCSPRGRG